MVVILPCSDAHQEKFSVEQEQTLRMAGPRLLCTYLTDFCSRKCRSPQTFEHAFQGQTTSFVQLLKLISQASLSIFSYALSQGDVALFLEYSGTLNRTKHSRQP